MEMFRIERGADNAITRVIELDGMLNTVQQLYCRSFPNKRYKPLPAKCVVPEHYFPFNKLPLSDEEVDFVFRLLVERSES